MNDDLKAALQSIDPMHSSESTESVTSPQGRRRLEDIMSTPVLETKETPPARSRAPWYAAAAAAVVAVLAIGVVALGPTDDAPVASAPLQLTAGESDIMASCIAPSPEILAPVEVAFAGTATKIDGETVTLSVTKWYTGGDSETVVVTAPAGFEALIGSVPFVVGEDFLISATGGVVNYCGLSGAATPELQAIFDGAFPG